MSLYTARNLVTVQFQKMCLLVLLTQTECRTRQVTHIVVHSRNHCCHGKEINITHSEPVSVAVFIRHTKRMYHIIFSSIACLAVSFCTHYLANRKIFGKNTLNIKSCFYFLYFFLEYFFLISIQRDIVLNVQTSSCKAAFIFVTFQ